MKIKLIRGSLIGVLLWLTGCALVPPSDPLSVVENDRAIVFYRGTQPLLAYQKAIMPAPEGESPHYARSGFIHPLYSPSGGLLTSIQPLDHFHHMGLWHAWVDSTQQGKALDFWNLAKGQAGVRYEETLAIDEGDEKVRLAVRQSHFSRTSTQATDHTQREEQAGETETKVVLEDHFSVELQALENAYLLDYVSVQTNVSASPITFNAYRYGGGIAYRGPGYWDEHNSGYLTSEGLQREGGHGSRARWVRLHGPTETGLASVVIMSHPTNPQSPQPVRIWPDGPMFFNYVPAQKTPLQLAPGETMTLRYRLIVSDGVIPPEVIESRWQRYAQ